MFNMKIALAALILCQVVVAVYPYCYGEANAACEPGPSVIDCHECTCSEDGTTLDCCFNIGRPTSMTPGCVAIFDNINCQYDVYNPDSPDAECKVFGEVGR